VSSNISEKNRQPDMAMSTDGEAAGRVLTMPGAPPAFHVTPKPTGAICNLDCGWHVKGRPLYTRSGQLVTPRSIGAEPSGWFMIDVLEECVVGTHCHRGAHSG